MSQIHILDKYNFEIKEALTNTQDAKVVLEDTHTRNIETHTETYDFTVDYRASQGLENRDRVLIPDEVRGQYREFIINAIDTDTEYGETEVRTEASYLEDLQKAKPLAPHTLAQASPQDALTYALRGTGWETGEVEYAGFRTISWTGYNTPFEALKIFANRFEAQLDFTIETRGNKVVKRLVHFRQSKDLFNGKEIRRGKDLSGLQRSTLSTEVITALIALGPEPQEGEGERLVIEIKDDIAQAQWGKAYNYLWGVYEPESSDENMTEARLRTLAKTELNKHNKPQVDYTIDAVSIEAEFPHEKVIIGDTVRIKDDLSEPYFYVDATVKEVKRSVFDASTKTFVLGEITEHQREDLRRYFNQMIVELRERLKNTDSNLDNIVTIIDTEVERRIYKQDTPPLNPINNQLWLDTSNPDKPILKRYFNGAWHVEIKAVTEPSDIGATTREQAMYEAILSSFINLKAAHEQLLAEALIIKSNKYANQAHLDAVEGKLQAVITTYNLLNTEILSHENTPTFTLEQANGIHQLMLDYSAAVGALRTAITDATEFAMAHLAYLQSQYTDEKYHEALDTVAGKFGLTHTDGVLTGDAVLMSDLESTRSDLETQLQTSKNTLTDMIDNITGDSRNMIIGTSLIDDVHFAVVGGHTILTDEILEYVRIRKEDEVGGINNKYKSDTKLVGTRLKLDGTEVQDAAYVTSDFIAVSPEADYRWHSTNPVIEHPQIIFYDANKEYLEGILYADDWNTNFTTPAATYFIKLVAPVDQYDDASWMLEEGFWYVGAEGDEAYILFHNKNDYLMGATYTLALDFRSSVVDELDYIFLSTDTSTHILHDTLTPAPFKLEASGEWKRYYMQFTPTETITDAQLKVGTDFAGDVVGDFDLRQIHLYKGENQIDWQPAPEDNRQFITQLSREIKNLEGLVASKLTRSDYDLLNKSITSLNTEVSQTATALLERATKSEVDAINNTVANHETRITTQAGDIETLITKTTNHDGDITTVTNKANETAEGLAQTITKVSTAEGAITKAQADIVTNTTEISKKLATATYTTDQNNVVSRLDAADSERIQLTNQISDRVTLTEYESNKVQTGTLGDANKTAHIQYENKGKWLRLASNKGDRAFGRFIVADKTSAQHGTVEFNASVYYGRHSQSEFVVNNYAVYTSFPFTKARLLTAGTYDAMYLDVYFDPSRDNLNNIDIWLKDNVATSGWVLEDLSESLIETGYTSIEYDINAKASTKGVLTTHDTLIEQNGKDIALRATKNELDSVNKTLAKSQAELILNHETITGRVDGLSGDLTKVSTLAQQTKDSYDISVIENDTAFTKINKDLATKVGEERVVASINASREGVKIKGDMLELTAGSAIKLAIDGTVKKGDVVSQINLDKTGTKINGDKIDISAKSAVRIAIDKAEADATKVANSKVAPNEVISSINIDKSGAKVSGNKVDISAGSAIKLAIDAAEDNANAHTVQKLNNLQIGGTNLIPKTDFEEYYNPPAGWKVWGAGGYINNRIQLTNNILVQNNSLTTALGFQSDTLVEELVEGQTYTLSFFASTSADVSTAMNYCYLMNETSGGANQGLPSLKREPAPSMGSNALFKYTVTVVATFSGPASVLIGSETLRSDVYGYIYMNRPQLEVGDKATAWGASSRDSVSKHRIISEINLDKSGTKISGDIVDIKANTIDFTANNAFNLVVADAKDAGQKATAAQNTADKAVPKTGVVSAINATNETVKISANRLALIGGKSITLRLNEADKAAEGAQKAADNAQADFDNIDIAGTNMLKHTNFSDIRNIDKMGSPWGSGSKYYTSNVDYLLVSTSSSSAQIGMRTINNELYFEPNVEYTLSFKAYASANASKDFSYVYLYRLDGSNEGSFNMKRVKLGKAEDTTYDLYEYSVTFTSTKDNDKPAQMLIADKTTATGVSTWVRIKDIMLTKGNLAVPYQLHPSEIVEKRNIISEINMNDQGVKMKGNNIELVAGDEISLQIADTQKKIINANVANNNIIANTDFWNSSSRFYNTHVPTATTTSGIISNPSFGKGWFRMVRSDGALSYLWTHDGGRNRFSVTAGTTYTFSVLVAQNYHGNDLNYAYMRRVSDSSQVRVTSHLVSKTHIGSVFGRHVYKYVYTYDSPFTSNNDTVMFFGMNNTVENRAGYYLSEWKLEEGSEATAYTEEFATKTDLKSQINLDTSGVEIQGKHIDLKGDVSMVSGEVKVRQLSATSGSNTLTMNGNTLTMSGSTGTLTMGNSGIVYKTGSTTRYEMSGSFVRSVAFGTTTANIYMAASSGYEVRFVDIRDVPGVGTVNDYRYIDARLARMYTSGVVNNTRYQSDLRLGADGYVKIMNHGLTTLGTLETAGLKADYLDLRGENTGNLYIRPAGGSEVRITARGTTDQYRAIRASALMANSIYSNTSTSLYLRADNEVRVTAHGSTGNYRDIRASSFLPPSSEKYKTEITDWDYSVLDIIKDETKLYRYKLTGDKQPLFRHGLVLERETPVEMKMGDGIDLYELASWTLKGVQELAHENDALKAQNAELEQRIARLEQILL